jgi:hypothetical protein
MFPFACNQTMMNQDVIITLVTSTTVDFTNIYCKHFTNSDGILFYKASNLSSTTVSCRIKVPGITKINMDESSIGLWVNSSTIAGGESGFYLSQNNVSHAVIREPVQSSIPKVVFKSQLPLAYSFNLTQLSSKFSYFVQTTPPFCTNYLNCTLQYFNFDYVPRMGSPLLMIQDSGSTISFSTPISYYSENITMNPYSPFPFILDPFKNKTTIVFDGIKNIGTLFDIYCLDKRNMKKIQATVVAGNILCDIESGSKDEKFFVEFYVNSSVPELNTLISETDLELRFDELKVSPSYIEKSQIGTFEILLNDSSKYIVPQRYRSSLNNFKLVTTTSPQTYGCSLSANNTNCTNGSPMIDVGSFNIYLVYFKFSQDTNDFMNISRPILVYKSNSIDSTPHGILFGQPKNVLVQFSSDSFNVDTRIHNVEYYCHVKENNLKYVATRLNNNQLNCTIPSLSFGQISLSAYIRVASVSSDYLLVSKNESIIYYIKQKSINFTNSVKPLFYTEQFTEIISFSMNTEIHPSLLNKVKCSLNTSDVYSQVTTYVSSNGNNSHIFNCSFSITTPGRVDAYLEFVEGIEKFSLTSNSLELIFTGKFVFLSFSPTVAITNVTNNVKMNSNFPSKDYGTNVKFITKFGFPGDLYNNQTKETNYTSVSNQFQFITDFFIADPASYSLSMWMESFGKQLEVLPPVSYKFIGNSYFLFID